MLTLFTWNTPNGLKPLILLEELEIPYNLERVDIRKGDQRTASYAKLNPNRKIPSLVDEIEGRETIRVFESGAILVYLAEKTGRFLATTGQARADALAWLMFQMSAVGPMLGQLFHFSGLEEEHPYARKRFQSEAERVYGVLEERLAAAQYLAGEYGIADIATYPWVRTYERFGIAPDRIPHVVRWIERIGKRPAVERAYATPFG